MRCPWAPQDTDIGPNIGPKPNESYVFAPCALKGAPRANYVCLNSAEGRPESAQGRPKSALSTRRECPKGARRALRCEISADAEKSQNVHPVAAPRSFSVSLTAQGTKFCFMSAPWAPRKRPKSTPRAPRDAPRAPTSAQGRPKSADGRSKSDQELPKGSSKVPPRALRRKILVRNTERTNFAPNRGATLAFYVPGRPATPMSV